METRDQAEQAYATTQHHVKKLLNLIDAILDHYSIDETDLHSEIDDAQETIIDAQSFLDPKPVTTFLTIVYRNSRPINAFHDQQKAINFLIRIRQHGSELTRKETRVAITSTDDLLTAEFSNGVWYFEPHDNERTYTEPLLLVPIV